MSMLFTLTSNVQLQTCELVTSHIKGDLFTYIFSFWFPNYSTNYTQLNEQRKIYSILCFWSSLRLTPTASNLFTTPGHFGFASFFLIGQSFSWRRRKLLYVERETFSHVLPERGDFPGIVQGGETIRHFCWVGNDWKAYPKCSAMTKKHSSFSTPVQTRGLGQVWGFLYAVKD